MKPIKEDNIFNGLFVFINKKDFGKKSQKEK
jgi:hypothetical protein